MMQASKDLGPSPFSKPAQQQQRQQGGPPVEGGGLSSHTAAVVLLTDDKWAEDYYDLQPRDSEPGSSVLSRSSDSESAGHLSQHLTTCMSGLKKYKSLLIAMLMCQVGMILFNLGLTYGFAALGDMTGVTLPSSFLALPYDPKSPYYSLAGACVCGVGAGGLSLFLSGSFVGVDGHQQDATLATWIVGCSGGTASHVPHALHTVYAAGSTIAAATKQ
jgi:hypothetical protein